MKKLNLKNFIRPEISKMEEYIPVPSVWDLEEGFIKLDAGENTYGFSARISKALGEYKDYNYYPDPEYKELRQALAIYSGVKMENIMVGSGSDELLDLLFKLVLNQGDKVINCPPTFGMYPVAFEINRGKIISVPRNEDFSLNLEKIKKSLGKSVKVIIVCTPNNPTGTVTSQEEIIGLLETQKLIIVDEAYFEFYGKSVTPLLQKYGNLIILRTLSKWAGIAGLRLGYAIMAPFLAQQLLKIKPPYNVNLAADIAGKIALKEFNSSQKIIGKIISERERVKKQLEGLPYVKIFPTKANLLFIQSEESIFPKLKASFIKNKIAVRFYESFNAVRLTIGRPEQNNKVVGVFKEFENEQN